MIATMASVRPSFQDTRYQNTPRMTTATTTRSSQTRILGLAASWARLLRGWPMPGCGSPAASSAGLTTGFHSGFGGTARPAERSPAGGSPPEGSRVGGSPAGGSGAGLSAGGDQSHNGRSADSGSAAAGSGTVASAPATAAAVSSAVAASSTDGPGQLTGASRTGASRTGPEPPAASVFLGPWARRNGNRAGPSGAPSASFPCDRAPSCAAPLRLPSVIRGPDDLFLSFGHAIRYHPPPQRNCHRTQRIAPSPKTIVPCPDCFYSWTFSLITRQTPGLYVVYDPYHGPDSRANHDRAGCGDPRGRTLAGRRYRSLSAPHDRTQRPGRRVLHDHPRIRRRPGPGGGEGGRRGGRSGGPAAVDRRTHPDQGPEHGGGGAADAGLEGVRGQWARYRRLRGGQHHAGRRGHHRQDRTSRVRAALLHRDRGGPAAPYAVGLVQVGGRVERRRGRRGG